MVLALFHALQAPAPRARVNLQHQGFPVPVGFLTSRKATYQDSFKRDIRYRRLLRIVDLRRNEV